MPFIETMKQGKHRSAQAARRARAALRDRLLYPVAVGLEGEQIALTRLRMRDGEAQFENFLERGVDGVTEDDAHRTVPKRIFVLWTGRNEMSENRRRSLDNLRAMQEGIEVVLLGPEDIDAWVVAGSPFHDAYEHLSLNHRSDYLRCYFMHHHGGGYTDLKASRQNWTPFFDQLNDSPSAWILGYPERASHEAAYLESPTGRAIRRRYASLAGNGAFIARSGTPFTADWFDEVNNRLDYYRRALRRRPAVDPFGQSGGYPLPWTVLQSQVFQPLQLKYPNRILLDEGIRPDFTAYR